MIPLFLLGLLAALAPCPFATNVAAASFIAREAGSRSRAAFSALAYALGRVAAYVLLGAAVARGLAAAPELSFRLQEDLPVYLGPPLMFVGLVVLGWVRFPSFGGAPSERFFAKALAFSRIGGAAALGFVFALALCPPSAAVFFGTALPLALSSGDFSWASLAAFGAGTATPVVLVAALLIFCAVAAGKILNALPTILLWTQRASGAIFLALGAYWTLTKIIF
ncbi:MAG: sulfite exporter TauE/SafE family protein [Candidatus Spyradosoma sp.]